MDYLTGNVQLVIAIFALDDEQKNRLNLFSSIQVMIIQILLRGYVQGSMMMVLWDLN